MKINRTVLGVFATIVGLSIWIFLMKENRVGQIPFAPSSRSGDLLHWVGMIGGYCTMVVGMVLGVLCRALIAEKAQGAQTVNIGAFILSKTRSIELWISLMASPLVFGSILRTGADLSTGAFVAFSLQTGFSSYVLIESLMGGAKTGVCDQSD